MSEVYPETKKPDAPTATLWLLIISFPMGFSYLSDFESQEEREAILRDCLQNSLEREERYFTCCGVGPEMKPIRLVSSGDAFTPYRFGMSEDAQRFAEQYVTVLTKRNDLDQIKRAFVGIADGTNFASQKISGAIDIGVRIIGDYLRDLDDYVAILSTEEKREFWEDFTNVILRYYGKFPVQRRVLIEMTGERLPEDVRTRIINASQQEDFRYVLTGSILWFFRDVLEDRVPFMRDHILRWALNKALIVPSLEDFILECIVYLGNLVYGGELFAVTKSSGQKE
jgi:hypothetical protein